MGDSGEGFQWYYKKGLNTVVVKKFFKWIGITEEGCKGVIDIEGHKQMLEILVDGWGLYKREFTRCLC